MSMVEIPLERRNALVRVERSRSNAAIAVVFLENEPVNSMTLELWLALAEALESLEDDRSVRSDERDEWRGEY